MSEKRFILCADMNWWEVKDNGTGKTICSEEVVGLLNHLHQENQQLQKEVKDWKFINDFQEKEIDGLEELLKEKEYVEEENEQLQQELQKKNEEEQLYANEILELREANKEFLQFKNLGGDY